MNRKILKVVLGASTIGSIGFAVLLGVGCNYSSTLKIDDNNYTKFGVGSQNYGMIISGKIAGEKLTKEYIDAQNKKVNEQKGPYACWLYASNKEYEEVQKDYVNAIDKGLPKEVIDQLKEALDFAKAPQTGYAMMVSGAVLFSIFAIALLGSIFLLKKVKPTKTNWIIKSEVQDESFNEKFNNFLASKDAISNKYESDTNGIKTTTFVTIYSNYTYNERLINEFFDSNSEIDKKLKDKVKLVSKKVN